MEIELIKFLQSATNWFLDALFGVFSFITSELGAVIIFTIWILFLLFEKYVLKRQDRVKKHFIYFIFCAVTYAISVGTNELLKIIINRPRPYMIDNTIIDKYHSNGLSMPSGHTTNATLIMWFLCFGVFEMAKGKSLKIVTVILASLFIIFTGVSRMYFGQHFISDVLVAILLASMFAFLGLLIYKKRDKIYENFRNHRKKE